MAAFAFIAVTIGATFAAFFVWAVLHMWRTRNASLEGWL